MRSLQERTMQRAVSIDAMKSSRTPHSFLGIDRTGRPACQDTVILIAMSCCGATRWRELRGAHVRRLARRYAKMDCIRSDGRFAATRTRQGFQPAAVVWQSILDQRAPAPGDHRSDAGEQSPTGVSPCSIPSPEYASPHRCCMAGNDRGILRRDIAKSYRRREFHPPTP